MDGTKFNRRFLKMLLKMQCEKETLDCVIHEMRAVLGEKMPEEDAVRAYLKDPGKKTTLTVGQQVLAMDKRGGKLPHDLRHGALPEHEGSGDGPLCG